MILAHMSAQDSAALARFVILAAFVITIIFLVVNFFLMRMVAKLVANHHRYEPSETPQHTIQFSLKTPFVLTAVVAAYACLIRFARFNGPASVIILIFGTWCATFIGSAWALYKTYSIQYGVSALPLVAGGAAAGAAAAALYGFWTPLPLHLRLIQVTLHAGGGGLGGMLIGLLFFGVARWTTRSR